MESQERTKQGKKRKRGRKETGRGNDGGKEES